MLKLLAFLMFVTLAIGCAGNAADTPAAEEKLGASLRQVPFRGAVPVSAGEWQIPAGTPIPIRLRSSISSATAASGDRFAAILDEDLQVEGKIVAAKGTRVSGRVLAARHSRHLQSPGYLRITLASMKLNGEQVHLQTSSIFLQGQTRRSLMLITSRSGSNSRRKEAELGIEQRLTFRLMQALVKP